MSGGDTVSVSTDRCAHHRPGNGAAAAGGGSSCQAGTQRHPAAAANAKGNAPAPVFLAAHPGGSIFQVATIPPGQSPPPSRDHPPHRRARHSAPLAPASALVLAYRQPPPRPPPRSAGEPPRRV